MRLTPIDALRAAARSLARDATHAPGRSWRRHCLRMRAAWRWLARPIDGERGSLGAA